MQPFVERMIEELGQLQGRLTKLEEFIGTDKFLDLDSENRELLLTQKDAMAIYSRTLQKRISLNKNA